jgi:hypothetical protein
MGQYLDRFSHRETGLTKNDTAIALRMLGALSLVGVGVVHLQQYFGAGFNQVSTIGTLFLLNGIASVIVVAGLIRRGGALFALAAIAISVGSLIALFISLNTPLFGFMEGGYRPAVVLSIVFEVATVILLAGYCYLLAKSRHKRSK